MPSGAAFGIALRGPWRLGGWFWEEREAAEYATLIQVSHPRRLQPAVRHRPRVRTQARIARPGAWSYGRLGVSFWRDERGGRASASRAFGVLLSFRRRRYQFRRLQGPDSPVLEFDVEVVAYATDAVRRHRRVRR